MRKRTPSAGHRNRDATGPPATGPIPQGAEDVPSGTVVGQAHRIEARTETIGQGTHQTVVTFRVERYDDAGNQILMVPVQMKGLSYEGSVSEGDWVQVGGRRRAGTLHAKELKNLTTGAVVKTKGVPLYVWVLFWIIAVFVLATFVKFLSG